MEELADFIEGTQINKNEKGTKRKKCLTIILLLIILLLSFLNFVKLVVEKLDFEQLYNIIGDTLNSTSSTLVKP